MSGRRSVSVDRIRVDGGTVTAETSCSRELRPFFADEHFRVSYGTDVSDVPEHVLAIPVVGQVCPVAWANGATVRTPALDREYLDGLRAVRTALTEMYPRFMQGGRIDPERVVDGARRDGTDDGLLFTGGVDSMATFLGHREEEPQLITVRGWVFGADSPEWHDVRSYVSGFADEWGVDANFVETNLGTFLNHGMLDSHFRTYLDGHWYASVGHGLGLLSICAPLAAAEDIGTVYVAATHHDGMDDDAWGSHPRIDGTVAWSGTRCVHDGYELSRQEKMHRIGEVLEDPSAELTLQTCNESVENCGRCAKCLRTMVGLLLAGIDPERVGHDFDRAVLDEVRARFDRPEFYLDESPWVWRDIQAHIDLDREFPRCDAEASAFFDWLAEQDVDSTFGTNHPPLPMRLKLAALRHTPYPVYSLLSSLRSVVPVRS